MMSDPCHIAKIYLRFYSILTRLMSDCPYSDIYASNRLVCAYKNVRFYHIYFHGTYLASHLP
jgi:hypothetical protein